MPAPSSLSLQYDAILSTTLFNLRKMIEDEISTTNALYHAIMKRRDAYEAVEDLGDRVQIPLMYGLAEADSYSGYDVLSTQPTDGITSAFFDWRQASVPVTVSGFEKKKNSGEAKIVDLMTAKTKQAVLGIQDLFGRALLQGHGVIDGTSLSSARVSPNNGSSFIDPIGLLVHPAPTSSVSVGNINQATYSWWQNQLKDSAASTMTAWMKELRNLYNSCGKGPGGFPDLHIADQRSYEVYEAALALYHQNPQYRKADIPFDNIAFKGNPLVWDEFVPDFKTGTVGITKGSWVMLNTKFWGIKYHKGTNFTNTPFERPPNQDAFVSQIMWLGAAYVSNRRKQGVCIDIDVATLEAATT